jgi:hypothetical protein
VRGVSLALAVAGSIINVVATGSTTAAVGAAERSVVIEPVAKIFAGIESTVTAGAISAPASVPPGASMVSTKPGAGATTVSTGDKTLPVFTAAHATTEKQAGLGGRRPGSLRSGATAQQYNIFKLTS